MSTNASEARGQERTSRTLFSNICAIDGRTHQFSCACVDCARLRVVQSSPIWMVKQCRTSRKTVWMMLLHQWHHLRRHQLPAKQQQLFQHLLAASASASASSAQPPSAVVVGQRAGAKKKRRRSLIGGEFDECLIELSEETRQSQQD